MSVREEINRQILGVATVAGLAATILIALAIFIPVAIYRKFGTWILGIAVVLAFSFIAVCFCVGFWPDAFGF